MFSYSLVLASVSDGEGLASAKTPIPQKTSSPHYAITDVTVIDMRTGVRAVKDILVKGEGFAEIGRTGTVTFPQHTRVINAAGQFAIPGLWDAHTHLTIVPGYAHQASKLYVANGVTSVRDMGRRLEDVVAPQMWIAGPLS